MQYNKILTDKDRAELKPTIDMMYRLVPEMAHNKIATAIVQQAFVYDTVFKFPMHNARILSAGSYMDTAAELLRFMGYAVYDVDPVINCDLRTFRRRLTAEFPNDTERLHHTIISTSVLEHTTNDEEFIDDICNLLLPGGYGILTMDFKDDWLPGQPVPYTSNRFYTTKDLTERLYDILLSNDCDLIDDPDYSARDTFIWDGINYSFATYVFRKAN